MKPNGRRRWRKWAKRWRRGQTLARADAILRRAKSVPLPGLSGAVAKKAKRSLPPPATCPFNPRSLVGMSQRRRKQLFHQLFDTQTDPETIYSGTWSRGGLRIGERLRPCLGCLECEPKDCDGCGFSLGSGEDCEVCDAHAIDRYVMGCNGSGILPAKRQP